ncbi:hypothetical protein CS022_21400 [Veronia nyctiphanis]|uniref:Uncharacterized protein n=1 Tax=Veronia nyctiphanis TaxID=1278244 RepID=A0A4Q0YQB4_9GAMM|nr:hypothetical protein [Veronia nyctiphanis]RXJ71221.1 hypothetical protein CS022_21400 [Veronia nyctiphanis]
MSDDNSPTDSGSTGAPQGAGQAIEAAPYRDRVDPKVADQTTASSAQSLSIDGLRDLSALSKLQVREFTHTGATQMQATSNAITQMAAAGAKAASYILDGGN